MSILLSPELLKKALSLAKQAGERLLVFYRHDMDIKIKQDETPVTNADLAVSQFLVEKLSALTPNIPVLSEENCSDFTIEERQSWSEYWLIDPLDGTQQFIDKSDQFSVIISLVVKNKPVLGIIHSPVPRTTFYAMKGFGAYKQLDSKIIKLETKAPSDDVVRITIGKTVDEDKLQAILNENYQYEFFPYGSSGLKGTLVAEGRSDCYVRLGKTGEWDTAAVSCLLEETGGKIYDFQLNELTYNQRDTLINPNFLMVGNPNLPWDKIFNLQ